MGKKRKFSQLSDNASERMEERHIKFFFSFRSHLPQQALSSRTHLAIYNQHMQLPIKIPSIPPLYNLIFNYKK